MRFHDGTPFDAQAVVANIASLRRAHRFPGEAERLGLAVVAITLDRPNAALLATLSQPFYSMVSPAALADGGGPVGTGPFRLAAARPGLVELRANPHGLADRPQPRLPLHQRRARSVRRRACEAGHRLGESTVMRSWSSSWAAMGSPLETRCRHPSGVTR